MSNLLINLSNHPSSSWEEPQREAAFVYGEIVDLPFPPVDESRDEGYIESLADEYAGIIKKMAKGKHATLHLMGEMTFTVALLKRMKAIGITCIASTSKRMVIEDTPGHKDVKFRFERFRKYNL